MTKPWQQPKLEIMLHRHSAAIEPACKGVYSTLRIETLCFEHSINECRDIALVNTESAEGAAQAEGKSLVSHRECPVEAVFSLKQTSFHLS
jgi:hypothetical protein